MKYIGLDAHSSTCDFAVMDHQGQIQDQAKMVTNGRLLVEYLKGIKGPKKLTLEECELSHWLYEILKDEVDELIVCNPVANGQYKGAKTDRLDAKRLADLLRGNFLSPVYHDGSRQERLRVLMSGYQDLINEGISFKNRYKSLFRKNGQKVSGEAMYQDESLLEGFKRHDYHFVSERVFNLLKNMEVERKAYVEEIKKISKQFPEMKYLKSIPGIKDIRAAQIVSQVIDPKRFRNKYKFYAYCGLVRYKRQSGGKFYGDKKCHGNRVLKCVYKMAAHQVLRGNNAFRKYYDRLRTEGVSDKNARNAVCRKISAVSLSVWIQKRKYDDTLLNKNLSS